MDAVGLKLVLVVGLVLVLVVVVVLHARGEQLKETEPGLVENTLEQLSWCVLSSSKSSILYRTFIYALRLRE
jgi:hypothetical protein